MRPPRARALPLAPIRARLTCRTPFPSLSPLNRTAARHASTSTSTSNVARRARNYAYGTSLALVLTFGYLYVTDTRATIHQWLVTPTVRWLYPDAEEAHEKGTKALKLLWQFGLHPRERGQDENKDLAIEVFGYELNNPIGISAGLDKHADIPDVLMAMGPAVVEVGGITPRPQEGNPKPRVFRIPSQNAIVNRYGLNSEGADAVAQILRERVRLFAYSHGYGLGPDGEAAILNGAAGVPPGSLTKGKLLAVQVAKNKDTPENDIQAVTDDCVYCVDRLAPYADILVVNVSSPNTPGLRTLQSVKPLTTLLQGVVAAAQNTRRAEKPKVMVKVSPDEDEDSQIDGIVEAIWRSGVDGVIVGNTTKRRTGLIADGSALSRKEWQALQEQGGYSGPQMFERTKSLVKRYRSLLDQGPGAVIEDREGIPKSEKSKVIFATGGITNGRQALEVLNAGASVAMVYTTMVYGGAGTITRIKREMREEIQKK